MREIGKETKMCEEGYEKDELLWLIKDAQSTNGAEVGGGKRWDKAVCLRGKREYN